MQYPNEMACQCPESWTKIEHEAYITDCVAQVRRDEETCKIHAAILSSAEKRFYADRAEMYSEEVLRCRTGQTTKSTAETREIVREKRA